MGVLAPKAAQPRTPILGVPPDIKELAALRATRRLFGLICTMHDDTADSMPCSSAAPLPGLPSERSQCVLPRLLSHCDWTSWRRPAPIYSCPDRRLGIQNAAPSPQQPRNRGFTQRCSRMTS